jgi:predicted Rdx family selenoprotein
MLSVGREINIETKTLLCRKCDWQGRGVELSTGLVRISHSDIYIYAFRCPECGSFDVVSKGKLLAFTSRAASAMAETLQRTADDGAAEPRSRRRN